MAHLYATPTDRLSSEDVVPLTGVPWDDDRLMDLVGNRRFVLLGEASHGSHEFYQARARITRRLIEEKGFGAVAVEADWPDASRVNRYVQGESDDREAITALADFKRFPGWMWRNVDMVDFVMWLRSHNDAQTGRRDRVGFYGLDLYSLQASMDAVVTYLESVDAEAAAQARERYSCFDHVQGEGPEYGHAVTLDLMVPCENEVVAQLVDLRRRAATLLALDGRAAEDELFFAEQNARLVHDAEQYYRIMYRGRVESWNLRDRHMAGTLSDLALHLDRLEPSAPAKVVVWEHNSHVGDARATELGASGELNVGQLVRSAWPDDCLLVGFTTDHGTVTAASQWGGPAQRKRVRPALAGSYESILHGAGVERCFVPLGRATPEALRPPRLERAIGVIYRPETERQSHWFTAHLPQQFDAVIHIDETSAVEPIERTVLWDEGEAPETYPTGL